MVVSLKLGLFQLTPPSCGLTAYRLKLNCPAFTSLLIFTSVLLSFEIEASFSALTLIVDAHRSGLNIALDFHSGSPFL